MGDVVNAKPFKIGPFLEPLPTNFHDIYAICIGLVCLAARLSNFDELKLGQKAQVIIEKHADIIDAELEHGDALHAHAEGEAAVFLRVDAHRLEDVGIDHAAAEDLKPAGLAADATARAFAEDAPDIDLGAGLGEGEIARAKAQRGARAEDALGEVPERPFEVDRKSTRLN